MIVSLRPAIVIVLLLLPSLVGLAVPCPDDLLIDMGGGPDQCSTGASPDASPVDSVPAVCPCACHFGISIAPDAPALPAPLVGALHAPMKAADLAAVPALITHPPVA